MNATSIPEQDRQIAEVMSQERSRLSNFIRKRVPNKADVEDLVQEVFCELVEAQRLLMPIDYVTGWLFRVARNRITDFFRKQYKIIHSIEKILCQSNITRFLFMGDYIVANG